VNLIIVGN